MKLLSLALPLITLSTSATADYVAALRFGIVQEGIFVSAAGGSMVDVSDGCRNPGIPALNTVCFDWANARGHFYYDGQGKRCLKTLGEYDVGGCSGGGAFNCRVSNWIEVPCTW